MKPLTFIQKVTRKLDYHSTILLGYLPSNRKYRPIGVKSMIQKNDDSIKYLELIPPHVSTLNLSEQFISDCSSYAKPKMAVSIPGDYIVTLKDGRIYSYDPSNTAIISRDGHLINELSFTYDLDSDVLRDASKNKVFELKGLTKPKKYKGTVFSLLAGGAAKTYYYHWMFDSLAKIALLKQFGKFAEVDYFLVPSYRTNYEKETLSHLGIREDQIIIEDTVRHLQADYLMMASYTLIDFHHPKWACDFLHQTFTLNNKESKRDKLIYIPRGDAAINRRVLNEAALTEELKKYGFESYFLSRMNVSQQAELFNSAKVIIGAHGSGFTNLVFCEPGAVVIELFPDKYVRHLNYDISNKVGLEYHYMLCHSDGNPVNTVDGQIIDMTVDIPAVKAKLDALLPRVP